MKVRYRHGGMNAPAELECDRLEVTPWAETAKPPMYLLRFIDLRPVKAKGTGIVSYMKTVGVIEVSGVTWFEVGGI
jgi:hypothetical protein